jgi:hypothetical protein
VKRALFLAVLAAAILLAGVTSYAAADSVTITKIGSGTAAQTATDTVTAKAAVNPKLILTVVTPNTTQTVDFGAVDPGTAYGPKAVTLTVSSNKLFNITKATSDPTPLGLSTTLANSTGNAKTASQLFTDNYSINVPWTVDPGSYSASTVQYTVVQQ